MRACRGGRAPRAGDRGSVTAEMAVALPALVMVLAIVLGGVSAGVAQVRCLDAARDAARQLARGEDPAGARRTVTATAPGAMMELASTGDQVEVVVHQRVEVAGLPTGFVVRGRAVARVEQP